LQSDDNRAVSPPGLFFGMSNHGIGIFNIFP
jgi:hypothetical protein